VQEGCILDPESVDATLRNGAAAGCTEALFTFGERPEEEPGFLPYLKQSGFSTILDYCEAMCRRSIGYGLLPHTNAGILSYEEMEQLRAVNASMGLMLETTAKISAHATSKGKDPEARLEMMEDAGRLKIPFTTGLLLGIGETMEDREDSLLAIRELHKRYGHIQEVIIQNFCPKPGTPMAGNPGPGSDEVCVTIQLARDILQKEIAVQLPPNLIDAAVLIPCGVDDLGAVSPVTIDYINPEHPLLALDELKKIVGNAELRERLCVHPRFTGPEWHHPDLQPLINRLEQTIRTRNS
jgi:FO synthase subunit 1